MSTFNFSGGQFNGPVQAGDHTTMHVTQGGAADPEATAAVIRLVELLRDRAPALQPDAEAVRGELERAREQSAEPDRTRLRQWLDTIAAGAGTVGGVLALVQEIRQAIGV